MINRLWVWRSPYRFIAICVWQYEKVINLKRHYQKKYLINNQSADKINRVNEIGAIGKYLKR